MFDTRTDAGTELADRLEGTTIDADVVLATSPGGYSVGRALAREIGVPVGRLFASELTVDRDGKRILGAVASDGCVWVDECLVGTYDVSPQELSDAVLAAHERAREDAARFADRELLRSLAGKSVVIVDDGASHEAVVLACLRNARAARADEVHVAMVTAPASHRNFLRAEADNLVTALSSTASVTSVFEDPTVTG